MGILWSEIRDLFEQTTLTHHTSQGSQERQLLNLFLASLQEPYSPQVVPLPSPSPSPTTYQHPPQTVLPELSDHSWAPASDRRESFWLPTEWRTLGKSPIAQLKERVRDLGSQLPYSRASVLGLSFQAVQRHKSRILNLKIEQMNRILAFFSFFSFSFKCNFSLSQEFQYEAHIFFMSALFSATFVSSLCVPAFPLTAGHITIPFFYWL